MKTITFTLTPEKADALCTLLSCLEQGSALQGLYESLESQGRPRHGYKLEQGTEVHRFYKTQQLVLLER